jgi:hypothetical protein
MMIAAAVSPQAESGTYIRLIIAQEGKNAVAR